MTIGAALKEKTRSEKREARISPSNGGTRRKYNSRGTWVGLSIHSFNELQAFSKFSVPFANRLALAGLIMSTSSIWIIALAHLSSLAPWPR